MIRLGGNACMLHQFLGENPRLLERGGVATATSRRGRSPR
jgi:hypothetical protein